MYGNKWDFNIEFLVKFKDGKAKENIKIVLFEKEDSTLRRKAHEKHVEEIKKLEKIRSSWWYPGYLYLWGIPFRFTTKLLRKIAKATESLLWKMERKFLPF